MQKLTYKSLLEFTHSHAAFRRRQRLQPVGGQGDKLFPPTYPGARNNDPPRHVYEVRRIGDQELDCVLLDSVQSQANRLEEALLAACTNGALQIPRLVVDFPRSEIDSVPEISSLDAPHRIFDAILRDSELDGKPFRESEIGQRVRLAKSHDATAILEISPTSLLFGAWNSTGEGGGLGAKFARAIVSEIIAVDVPVQTPPGSREGERDVVTSGRRTGSRIDPLGVLRAVEVFKGDAGWDVNKAAAGKGAKAVRPSEINHGNIAPSVEKLGITCAYAEQISVITLAGLRRLRFGGDQKRDAAARAYLAALGLAALVELDQQGYALRSRCDLVCEGAAPLELVSADGAVAPVEIERKAVQSLHERAYEQAVEAGFNLSAEPLRLLPQQKLIEIVRRSQEKALHDEGGAADENG